MIKQDAIDCVGIVFVVVAVMYFAFMQFNVIDYYATRECNNLRGFMSEFGNDIIALKILFNQNEFKWVKPVIVTEDLLICEDTDGTIINATRG